MDPPAPRPGRWAAVAVLAALAAGSYGLLLNDEMDQASALHNLAQGSLAIHEYPAHFYVFSTLPAAIRQAGPVPVGSTLLDDLAVPVLFLLRALAWLAPLHLWVAAGAAALAWSLLPVRRSVLSLGGAFLLFLLLAGCLRGPEPNLERFGEVVALQFTNLALLGATAAFVCLAVRRHLAGHAAGLVGGAILAGPLLFWGSRQKYTLLAAALVAAAVWLAGEPASRRRNLALGLVAGLAVWNNVGEGAVLCLAVGLWVLTDALAQPKRLALLGSALAGVLGALAPWLLENWALFGNPFAVQYLQSGALAGPTPTVAEALRRALYYGLGLNVWHGPLDFGRHLLGAWTFGQDVQGTAVGVFALSPLLAGSVWALARRAAWTGPLRLAALAVALQIVLLTNRVVLQGWGLDARLLAPLLPAVGALAAFAWAPAFSRWERRDARRAWLAAVLLALAGMALLAALVVSGAAPQLFRRRDDLRLALLLWLAVLGFVAALAVLGGPALRLPRRTAKVAVVAACLAMPLLWTGAATFGAQPHAVGDRAGALLPGVQLLRDHLDPLLLPPPPWPAPVVVNGQTVFDPVYGLCQTDPSPCPWGNPNV